MWLPGSNSGHQAWQWEPSPTEPSCLPLISNTESCTQTSGISRNSQGREFWLELAKTSASEEWDEQRSYKIDKTWGTVTPGRDLEEWLGLRDKCMALDHHAWLGNSCSNGTFLLPASIIDPSHSETINYSIDSTSSPHVVSDITKASLWPCSSFPAFGGK